jgi:type II secretory pathway pseudopilin PulG
MVPGRSAARGEAGFSLIELLVVFVVGIRLVSMMLPAIQRFTHRANLEMIARETTSLIQVARREAVKNNVTTNVVFDYNANQIFAYVDSDGSNLEETGERELGRFTLPQKTYFWAGEDAVAEGTNALINFDDSNICYNVPKPPPIPPPAPTVIPCTGQDGIAAFRSDGSAARTGAVRFGDEYRNYLEVRIAIAATGKIELRKWNTGTSTYLLRDENGNAWAWYP